MIKSSQLVLTPMQLTGLRGKRTSGLQSKTQLTPNPVPAPKALPKQPAAKTQPKIIMQSSMQLPVAVPQTKSVSGRQKIYRDPRWIRISRFK